MVCLWIEIVVHRKVFNVEALLVKWAYLMHFGFPYSSRYPKMGGLVYAFFFGLVDLFGGFAPVC